MGEGPKGLYDLIAKEVEGDMNLERGVPHYKFLLPLVFFTRTFNKAVNTPMSNDVKKAAFEPVFY